MTAIKGSFFINIYIFWHFETVLSRYLRAEYCLTLCLLVLSADNLCKQLGPRSGLTKHHTWSGSKLFDTLMVFPKEFFEKVDFEKNRQTTKKHEQFPSWQRVKLLLLGLMLDIIFYLISMNNLKQMQKLVCVQRIPLITVHPFQINKIFHKATYYKVRMVNCIYKGVTGYNFKKIMYFSEDWFGLSKQCIPWWNAALCSISSGSSLFAKVPV